MIRYKINAKHVSKQVYDEIMYYIKNKEFLQIISLSHEYYIEGYYGDYRFKCKMEEGDKYITVDIIN